MHSAASQAITRDADIVARLRRGERDSAFAALLERYEEKIYRLCCALLGERTQAEDAAQDTLVRLWQALDRYDGRAALSTWIYAIARNRCLTALARRHPVDSLENLQQEPGWAERLEHAGDTAAVGDWRAEQLRELVALLPERPRQVLRLYYFEERSVSEVALMLGWPEGTVKTALFRARAALARVLERHGLADPTYWQEVTP